MTIRKGEPWGEPAVCPPGTEVVASDRQLRERVVAHRLRDEPLPAIGLNGGDMARTCGGGVGAHPSAARVTIDVMCVTIDQAPPTWAVAHVVARRSWLRGEVTLVMNAQYLGRYDISPRSHPNDGRVDVLNVEPGMTWRERMQARRRARTGAHLPHPRLSMRSLAEVDLTFARPMRIWVDGVRCGAATSLRVTVEPDALTLYV